jgi:6-phosphogluconate dehydrogenase
MVGLGVMGRNLLLNIAERGVSAAGYDKDVEKVKALADEAGGREICPAESLPRFIEMLRVPRAVLMLVPAGSPVDAVIRDLMPRLEPGDVLIDGGNSHFRDTDLRARALAEKGIRFLGLGISGGEHGARYGPSLMPGGPQEAYERVRPILEACAARVDGEPCVIYLGPGSSGHFVKMVHNGIEYASMQLIAESFDLMRRGLGLGDEELQRIFTDWNQAELNSYLLEITAHIFRQVDEATGKRLIDVILDEAGQKGTGLWTAEAALELGVPTPAVDAAVWMRNLSAMKTERVEAGKALAGPDYAFEGNRAAFLDDLRSAVYVGMALAYAQGFALLRAGSQAYGYGLHLEDIARIWRGGCIIRAALLDRVRQTYQAEPDLANLLLDPGWGQEVTGRQGALRSVAQAALRWGIPVPGLAAALMYFDAYRSPWLPANLIQAMRDYFGAHTFERIDAKGVFHTSWTQD